MAAADIIALEPGVNGLQPNAPVDRYGPVAGNWARGADQAYELFSLIYRFDTDRLPSQLPMLTLVSNASLMNAAETPLEAELDAMLQPLGFGGSSAGRNSTSHPDLLNLALGSEPVIACDGRACFRTLKRNY